MNVCKEVMILLKDQEAAEEDVGDKPTETSQRENQAKLQIYLLTIKTLKSRNWSL